MPFKIRRVLVAIADGSAKTAVDRAAQLVDRYNAHIELFSVVRPVPPVLGMTRVDDAQITRAWVDARRKELEKAAARPRRAGIAVTCTAVADFSVTEAIVRRALHSKADLVVIEAHKHNILARLFLSQNDHDLVRECPVPLLVVKRVPPPAQHAGSRRTGPLALPGKTQGPG